MKKAMRSVAGVPGSTSSARPDSTYARTEKLKSISQDQLREIFLGIDQRLREGQSSKAELILRDAIENYSHEADDFADLKRLLAYTLETVGRYKESLEVLKPFEDEEILERLNIETQVRVITQLAISYNGERSAPFMLGKIYTDMSGAYWFLRRPQDGVECLEKSIRFFEQTEHVLNSVIAYNNLGINLMLIGEWPRAEEMIRRALDLA